MFPKLRHAAVVAALPMMMASAINADEDVPSYAKAGDLMRLDNGVVIEGADLTSPDGYTTGFRVTAGFSPSQLPRLDFGAELAYRESDEVPTSLNSQHLILDTVSLGGAVLAGVRVGRLGFYAKSGIAGWHGDSVTRENAFPSETGGTTWLQGFGAKLQFDRLISRLEYEEIDAPSLAHLNLATASIHYPF
ncbi:hypothetical protein [Litchfieldella qijiaojingensis]|nr:hypothetical protein [Halomonas qijiaojingensis]